MKIIVSKLNYIKNTKSLIYVLAFFTVLFLLLLLSHKYIDSVQNSIDIFVNGIIPSLFPFILLSEIAINTNIFDSLSRFVEKPISKIFNVSKYSTIAIIVGFLCGFPSGSKAVNTLYTQGKISEKDANILLSFVNNSNPAFIISTIGVLVFNNISIGIILAISHYASSIIIGIIYSRYYNILNTDIIHESDTDLNSNLKIYSRNSKKERNVVEILKKCILNSFITLGIIFGFIVIFNLLFDILNVVLQKISVSEYFSYILSSIFEITRGSYNIANLNLSYIYVIIIESLVLGFSGLCIIFQVISSIDNLDIRPKRIVIFSIIHGILSAIITYILLRYTNILDITSLTISASIDQYITIEDFRNNVFMSYIYSIAYILIILSACMIYMNLKKRKKGK